MRDTLIIMPAFNEESSIGQLLEKVRALRLDVDLLVVDDGSSDDTATVSKQAGAIVLRLPYNLGYGGALQTGLKYALENNYRFAVQLDADGQHEPACIPKLLSAVQAGEADVVLGSRFRGEGDYNVPWARGLGIRFFGWIASLVIGQKITDPTSGYQALSRDTIRFYASEHYPVDFPDADVLIRLHRAGLRIAELPVTMYPRSTGKSMHRGIEPLYYVFKMLLSIFVTLLRKNTFAKSA